MLFDILADPTRRRILEALRDQERSVGELVDIAGVAQSGVSRHLGILQRAGFVTVRRDGQRRLYSLRPEPFQDLDTWMAGYRRLWQDRLDRLGEVIDREPTARKERSA